MGTATISASDLRSNLADTLDAVSVGNVVVVERRGKTPRVIIDIDEFEDLLAAADPAYLREIKAARRSGTFLSHEDVFGNL